jgi:HD-GYP domain-containing protein (c-di-GMP phosphodiesterase class II)
MTKQETPDATPVTPQFQWFVLLLAVSLTGYRLLQAALVPEAALVPDEVLITIMLFLVGYLWIKQSQALYRLSKSEAALHESQVGVLTALVEAVEAKDPYTRGHSDQVRRLSVELAKKMGLTAAVVAVVSRAAALHDLGKIETPDAILHKQTALTREEWEVLKKHPARTATILASLGFLRDEARVAVLHHERYDGGGYATGIKGEQIPIESSIISVADTFDAMNSDRPYRPRLPRETILAELKKTRGAHHPATVVDAFVQVLAEHPELWNRTQEPVG